MKNEDLKDKRFYWLRDEDGVQPGQFYRDWNSGNGAFWLCGSDYPFGWNEFEILGELIGPVLQED